MSPTSQPSVGQRKSVDRFISWDKFIADSRQLAVIINARFYGGREIKGIVAVSRGGLIPAAIVARELDVRMIDTICLASYEGQVQQPVVLIKKYPDCANSDSVGWVVVDDLVDSGRTAFAVRSVLPGACYAVVYAKPEGIHSADVFVESFHQHHWLHFPWESTLARATPLKGAG